MPRRSNNEGSIFKDKSGRWRGLVSVPQSDGTVSRKYVYGKNRKEVASKVADLLRQIQTKTYAADSKITFYEWLCEWMETYMKADIRPTTLVNYETYIHKHIQSTIGKLKLTDLTPQRLQAFFNEKSASGKLDGSGGLSPKTLRNMFNMIHKSLDMAVRLEMLPRNPSGSVVLPKRQKLEMRYFSVEEQHQLQEVIKGHRLELPILVDLFTGLRQGELLGLTWDAVHLDEGYLEVKQSVIRIQNPDKTAASKTALCVCPPKTANSIRKVPLLPAIVDRLRTYREEQQAYLKAHKLPPSDFVFTSTTGTAIDPRDFQRDFRKILVRNHIRLVNVHGLRHTFACRSLEAGMSIKTLSAILGHFSTAFTMDTYCHASEELKASEIENLREFLS